MRKILVKTQVVLVVIVMAMLINLAIESIISLFDLKIRLRYLLLGCISLSLLIGLVLRFKNKIK
jgi:hypothetical protein